MLINILKQSLNIRNKIGGTNPWFNIFHFQFLTTYHHNKWLKKYSKDLNGLVLDYGCGLSPYKCLFKDNSYVAADIYKNSNEVLLIKNGYELELGDNSIDSIISTQVLEHVEDIDLVLSEFKRVLKPGGKAIITMPFMFYAHGQPYDFRRYTTQGLVNKLKEHDFKTIKKNEFGNVFTTSTIFTLASLEIQNRRSIQVLKILLIPIYFLLCPLLNMLALALGPIDKSSSCYSSFGLIIKNEK